jgi:hypothetical protein
MSTTLRAATPRHTSRVRIHRALIVVGAVAAALAAWALAGPLAGIDLAVGPDGEQTVEAGAVIAGSLVSGLMAWALLAVLERTMRRPVRAWVITAIVALLLSLSGPLGAADTASKLALIGLHLVVASVLIPGLARSRPAA